MKRNEHSGREDLAGEHPLGDSGQLILLVTFLGLWIADSFFLKWSTFLVLHIPVILHLPVAALLLVCGAVSARQGHRMVFGEEREGPEIFQDGVFGIVRHPIYLGAILAYLGLTLLTLSLAALALWVIILVFYMTISRFEEKLLVERFGEAYLEYMERVPMLIPVIGKGKAAGSHHDEE